MNFNGDFDFDGYDDGMDDDFSEDLFEEEFEPELDEFKAQEENDESFVPESENPESAFDFREAFILGGIIVGQAYEEALDEKEQRDEKGIDDGDNSI